MLAELAFAVIVYAVPSFAFGAVITKPLPAVTAIVSAYWPTVCVPNVN